MDRIGQLVGLFLDPAGKRAGHDRLTRDRRFLPPELRRFSSTGDVEKSGKSEPKPVRVGETAVTAWLAPGHGEELAQRISSKLGGAKRRIRIGLSGPDLGADPRHAGRTRRRPARLDIGLVVDEPQCDRVFEQWERTQSKWKVPLLEEGHRVAAGLRQALPYRGDRGGARLQCTPRSLSSTTPVILGSFNLSRSGERNAENMVEIDDPALAELFAGFIDSVRARYPRSSIPGRRNGRHQG